MKSIATKRVAPVKSTERVAPVNGIKRKARAKTSERGDTSSRLGREFGKLTADCDDAVLIGVRGVGHAFQRSRASVYELMKAGTVPRPDTYIGRSPRWRAGTIRAALTAL